MSFTIYDEPNAADLGTGRTKISNRESTEVTRARLRLMESGAKRQVANAFADALEKYPELRIEAKNVPADEDGFLAIYRISKDDRLEALKSGELLRRFLAGELDAEELGRLLEEHREIGALIEQIAAMKDSSSANLPLKYLDNFGPGVRTMSEYLLLKSLLATETSDESGAFRYAELATGLNSHLRNIEEPNFFTETILVVLEMNLRSLVLNEILPRLGEESDLASWRPLLEAPDDAAGRYADVMKGEWNHNAKTTMFMFFHEGSPYSVPDPAETFDAYASWMASNVRALPGSSFKNLEQNDSLLPGSHTNGLSERGAKEVADSEQYFDLQLSQFVRASAVFSVYDAAMDLLIREQSGMDLSGVTESFILNPINDLPFNYDPASRALSASGLPSGKEIKPLTLPQLK